LIKANTIVEQNFKDGKMITGKHELFLVMDNAKYNHGKLFKEHLKKKGNTRNRYKYSG